MFSVRKGYGRPEEIVYGVKEIDGVTYFLLHEYLGWEWHEASEYIPFAEESD